MNTRGFFSLSLSLFFKILGDFIKKSSLLGYFALKRLKWCRHNIQDLTDPVLNFKAEKCTFPIRAAHIKSQLLLQNLQ